MEGTDDGGALQEVGVEDIFMHEVYKYVYMIKMQAQCILYIVY